MPPAGFGRAANRTRRRLHYIPDSAAGGEWELASTKRKLGPSVTEANTASEWPRDQDVLRGAQGDASVPRGDDVTRSDSGSGPGEEGIWGALRSAPFRNLWLAELLSQTALNAIWYAGLVATEQETRSTSFVSLSVVSAALPVALFGLLAGILVDRWDKRRVLYWSNVLRVGISLGYLAYGWSILVVFAMNFAINTLAQFFSPAMLASIPRLLPKRLLTPATGLFNVTLNVSQVLGMVILGPPLIKLAGPRPVFFIAALLYAFSTVLVMLLPASKEPRQAPADSGPIATRLRSELSAGWAFVREDRQSWLALIYLSVTWTILFSLATLAPRFAASENGLRLLAEDAIFLLAPAGLGMALAAAAIAPLQRRFGRWWIVSLGLLGLGVALAVLAVLGPVSNYLAHGQFTTPAAAHSSGPWLLVGRVGAAGIIAALAGWWTGVVTVSAEAVLLERAPEALRGRVFALQLTFTNLASILPLLAVGAFADLVGIDQVIGLTAAVVGVVWLLTLSPFVKHPPYAAAPQRGEVA